MSSVFDPKNQEQDLNSRIVVGLERIGEAFKVSLWEENKKYGLSPTQLQIITFLLFHPKEFRTISNIANEFNTTKASISDSVKALETKGFITREKILKDFRVSTINLTENGKEIAVEAAKYADRIEEIISGMPREKKETLMETLLEIIHQLFNQGIISIQRMCLTCKYYVRQENSANECTLLQTPLKVTDLRVDCNNYDSPGGKN